MAILGSNFGNCCLTDGWVANIGGLSALVLDRGHFLHQLVHLHINFLV
jgi:hypothetical protein